MKPPRAKSRATPDYHQVREDASTGRRRYEIRSQTKHGDLTVSDVAPIQGRRKPLQTVLGDIGTPRAGYSRAYAEGWERVFGRRKRG